MTELSCRTVRRWLQAPDALALIDARHMDRHLAGCVDCTAYRREQVEHDRLIAQRLDGAVGTSSVRQAVLSRLAQEHPRSRRVRRHLRIPLRALVRPALVLTPVAIVAALVLVLIGPQVLNRHTSVPSAVADWRAQRPTIGYPLAIDPRRPQHVLVGAWGQIYQSWNAGQSWQQAGGLPAGLIIRDLTVDTAHPNRYIVAALHSVYVSDDAGKHWVQTAGNLRGAENMFLVQDPSRPQDFYVGPSVLWKSTNGARTWAQAGNGRIFAPYGIQSLAVDRGALYTGIWGGGVAVSHDGGLTWQRRMRGLSPNVLSVSTGPTGRLWAATDRGIYVSSNAGLTWKHRGPSNFLVTSILDAGNVVLAGGDGSVLRSTDGGRRWVHAQVGLPGDPYVYGLLAEPRQPGRVYASTNGDGIFRSDDGGQTWQDANAGLPIARQEGRANLVVFLRDGEVWQTTSHGADPGNLTVDSSVRSAVISSDGASVAYVSGSAAAWSIRTVSAGGSAAHTLLTGTGALPRHLRWSPSATGVVAVIEPSRLVVANLAGHTSSWSMPVSTQLLGWTKDGQGILLWNSATQTVEDRARDSGSLLGRWPGRYPGPPLRSPTGSGTVAALVAPNGDLSLGTIGGAWRTLARTPGCVPAAWSDTGTRLLLQCRASVEIRSTTGRLLALIPGTRHAMWAPDGSGHVLFFKHHALWSWSPSGIHRLLKNASPTA